MLGYLVDRRSFDSSYAGGAENKYRAITPLGPRLVIGRK